jgi:hypothetical protein
MNKTMRKLQIGLLTLGLQGLAISAAAQEAYGAGAVGRSSWAFDCGANGCDRSTTSWRLAGGYWFNRVVAVEGFYFDLGRARSTDFSLDGRLGATGFGAQTLVGWRFADADLAGKIGLADMRNEFRAAPTSSYASSRVHRTELIAGFMAAVRLSPGVAVRLDADIVTVALNGDALFYSRGSDVTTVWLGLMIRF